ncbi:MAG TPA: TrmH family RNA methyltransferase, partial [Acetobacteraceae bacterium]|nr:TrmH family RNA methyltransferase [Acetobacteraceae bacterium]
MKPPHSNRPGGGNRPPGGGGHGGPPRHHGHPNDRQPRRDQPGTGQGGPQRPGGPQGNPGKPFQNRDNRQRNAFHQPDRPRHHDHRPRPPDTPRGAIWLYGLHAVSAALANPGRRLRHLMLTEEAQQVLARRQAPPWPLAPEQVDRSRLDHLLGRDIAHQGAALLADPLPTPSLQQALERPGPLIVLDQVTDPRNVGAILRSAAAFGAATVITQDRNAPEETGALAKAASGALETVPL